MGKRWRLEEIATRFRLWIVLVLASFYTEQALALEAPHPGEYWVTSKETITDTRLIPLINQALAHHDRITGHELVLISTLHTESLQDLYLRWRIGHRAGSSGALISLPLPHQDTPVTSYFGEVWAQTYPMLTDQWMSQVWKVFFKSETSHERVTFLWLLAVLEKIESPAATLLRENAPFPIPSFSESDFQSLTQPSVVMTTSTVLIWGGILPFFILLILLAWVLIRKSLFAADLGNTPELLKTAWLTFESRNPIRVAIFAPPAYLGLAFSGRFRHWVSPMLKALGKKKKWDALLWIADGIPQERESVVQLNPLRDLTPSEKSLLQEKIIHPLRDELAGAHWIRALTFLFQRRS